MGICSFLPKEFKEKLIEISKPEDLVACGYTLRSAYNVKHNKIISDERCDKLIEVLGERAFPVLQEAFQAFVEELSGLGIPLSSQAQVPDTAVLKRILDEVKSLEQRLNDLQQSLTGLKPKWTEKDLDRIYYQICGDTGLTMIKYLRQQMGMSLEDFMARFRDYIIQNYELHPGGDEGILLNGTMHGVIRRKDFDPMRKRMYL